MYIGNWCVRARIEAAFDDDSARAAVDTSWEIQTPLGQTGIYVAEHSPGRSRSVGDLHVHGRPEVLAPRATVGELWRRGGSAPPTSAAACSAADQLAAALSSRRMRAVQQQQPTRTATFISAAVTRSSRITARRMGRSRQQQQPIPRGISQRAYGSAFTGQPAAPYGSSRRRAIPMGYGDTPSSAADARAVEVGLLALGRHPLRADYPSASSSRSLIAVIA